MKRRLLASIVIGALICVRAPLIAPIQVVGDTVPPVVILPIEDTSEELDHF